VLFLFLIIILVLFLLFKVRNSRIKQENVITKLVLENTTLEKKILNQKLEAKNKDIVSIITDKKIRTNFLKLLLERMELFVNKNNEDKSSGLLSIINDVKAQITLENRLSVLESDINNVNTNFEAIIMERYPSLSKTEREVCAFIKLNLSIKETAIIRGVSQDSIKMARSRIRKKLKLDSKEELDKYIQSI
jgi:DNA-binding CsgD family transcriptional regulator